MNIFKNITSHFQKEKQTLKVPDSFLVTKLKNVATKNGIAVFQDITIYHHSSKTIVPLMLVHKDIGIYLFEYKDWSYDELKNAEIQKATEQESKEETLAFQKTHIIIRQRFKEIAYNINIPIYNFLLMENLNFSDYEHLDKSFHKLLPKINIMFSDSSSDEIIDKLTKNKKIEKNLPSIDKIMATISMQYCIYDNNNEINFATKEQMKFIDAPVDSLNSIVGGPKTGKTSAVILKSLLEKLKNPSYKILILKPTTLACDILKSKILQIIEFSIVEVDITTIDVSTPENLLKQKNKNYDLVFCDDIEFYSVEFINKLNNFGKNTILIKSSSNQNEDIKFTKSFKNQNKELNFLQTNPHAKALQLVSKLLITNEPKDILVVSLDADRKKLLEDLQSYIKDDIELVDGSLNLIDNNLKNLLLATYDDIFSIDVKHIILMGVSLKETNLIKYACELAQESSTILYQEQSENISLLKERLCK
jgi:hypothetical protein